MLLIFKLNEYTQYTVTVYV